MNLIATETTDCRFRRRKLLQAVYGAAAAGALNGQIDRLLQEFRLRLPPVEFPRESLGLTQRDALLITYGDMVQEPKTPPLQSLGDFCSAHLNGSLSGVHLLPHFPYTSDDGFAVTDYLAVNPALGSWQDVERLGRSFELMFDAVFNHLSAQSEWFRNFLAGDPAFADFFVTVEGNPDLSQVVRPRALPLLTEFPSVHGPRKVWTTFSSDQVDLNFQNSVVLLATLRALLFYVEHGARFIRLDAIAYLWKEVGTSCIHLPQTHQIIQLWRAVLDEVAPRVLLITETNVPHRDNISYFGDGANEAQLVYNFALPPLVLHALLRGDASHLCRWAQTLEPAGPLVSFFNFLASHDGIGLNPARGILPESEISHLVERCLAHGGFISYKHNADGSKSPYEMNIVYFDALNDPAGREVLEVQIDRFMVAQAMMLALRGLPGIYFHSLFGSRNDRPAAVASGIPRRINRRKCQRAALEKELADPASLPARVFARFQQLLAARRQEPAFHPEGGQHVVEADSRVFALVRERPEGGGTVLALHNVSGEPVSLTFTGPLWVAGENWSDLLSQRQHRVTVGGTLAVNLGPYAVQWLCRTNNHNAKC